MSEAENINGEVVELDVLAVFSHPDDAELTAAGTLVKMKHLGYRTRVLDVTRGEMGTRGTPEVRAEEAREAARIMGLDVRLNLEQPDGHVWPTEEARRALVRAILAHRSQFYAPASQEPLTRISEKGFLQQLEHRWRYVGSLIGVAAGEAFYVREALNVQDPVALLTRPMNIYS